LTSPRLLTASTISGSGCSSRLRVDADLGAGADRAHRLRLGEDLRRRADADLEVLRPQPCASSTCFRRAPPGEPGRTARGRRRSRRPRRRARLGLAGSPRACSSITRSSMRRRR
jgi:hypothetical protein